MERAGERLVVGQREGAVASSLSGLYVLRGRTRAIEQAVLTCLP